MKRKFNKINLLIILLPISLLSFFLASNYNKDFVEIASVKYKGEQFHYVLMKRQESNNKIKVKYFAANELNNSSSIIERYNKWSYGKNVILLSSGAYMDNLNSAKANMVGFTVDNGVVVNQNVDFDKDALVVVYATGGMVVSNLKSGNLKVTSGEGANKKDLVLDIRNNSFHRTQFINWCKENQATVFQTHLLAIDNKLTVFPKGSKDERERRVLVVGRDINNKLVHLIIDKPTYSSLYNAANNFLDCINNSLMVNVIFMINLDPGAQDIFTLYNSNGSVNNIIKGQLPIDNARNLLVYFE